MTGDCGQAAGEEIRGLAKIAFAGLREPLLNIGPWRRGNEIFIGNGIATAVIIAGAVKFQAEDLAEETTAPVITNRNDWLMRELRDSCLELLGRRRPNRQVDCVRQMISRKFSRVAHIDKYSCFGVDEIMHLCRIEKHTLIAIRRQCSQIVQGARLQSGQRTAFDQPLFQAATRKRQSIPSAARAAQVS